MPISNLPASPSRNDTPANFITKADAFVAALPTFVTEANATAAAMNLNATNDTSASSVLIGTGSKTFTVSASKSFQPGMYLVIAATASPTVNSLNVQVATYSGTTLIVNVISVSGSGTLAAWTISQSTNFIPADGSITTSKLADLSVTKAKLSADAVTDKIQPITATIATNALTLTLNPTALDFRATTLGSGTVTTVSNAANVSTVISSGSTGGSTNAVLSRIVVLAINNAGTIELAWVNQVGGLNLDETGVITTTAEGGAGAADSATVIYSTTARTGVSYRVVGYIESTQATAGTWATAPSLIQGAGGQSILKLVLSPMTLGTVVATTSGTAIDFSSLPAGIKQITITCTAVSFTALVALGFRLGSAGVPLATGYITAYGTISTAANTTTGAVSTVGFLTPPLVTSAANDYHGTITFTLHEASTNTWTGMGMFTNGTAINANIVVMGSVALSGTLDIVRLYGGTFDAGKANIAYI